MSEYQCGIKLDHHSSFNDSNRSHHSSGTRYPTGRISSLFDRSSKYVATQTDAFRLFGWNCPSRTRNSTAIRESAVYCPGSQRSGILKASIILPNMVDTREYHWRNFNPSQSCDTTNVYNHIRNTWRKAILPAL